VQPQDGRAETEASLVEAVEAWLPTPDPHAKAMILSFLRQAAASGLDPIAVLRDGLWTWFGPRVSRALLTPSRGAAPTAPGVMEFEPLKTPRRPTMWPQRPKRIPGELFASWLWRTAVAAGVPPCEFAGEELGRAIDDIDRDVAPTTLRRLALVSGQSFAHLAGGTLSTTIKGVEDTPASVAESVLLQDGRFLLVRRGHDRQGRELPVLQYCPKCLETDPRPYFRRVWRFSPMAVCIKHGCRLHDRCWNCAAAIEPIEQRAIDVQPRCATCGVMLSEAKHINSMLFRPRQRALSALLFYLGAQISADERGIHLDALSSRFRGVAKSSVAVREQCLATLRPSNMEIWFGTATHIEHAASLRMLAEGIAYGSLAKIGRRRELIAGTAAR